MAIAGLNASAVAAALVLLSSTLVFVQRRRRPSKMPLPRASYPLANTAHSDLPGYIQLLLAQLPQTSLILQSDVASFQQALDHSWAQTVREIIPAAIIRPADADQLAAAVRILSDEHIRRRKAGLPDGGFFAIRAGGANPSLSMAAGPEGVLLDLSRFNEVTVSPDRSTVAIGSGAIWPDVYKNLEKKGLTVAGARNSRVGVGGFSLMGGISFYAGQYGFACSSILQYEVALASGSVVTVSPTSHPSLFRALKGGSSNFGVVTRITLTAIPSRPLWDTKVLCAPFQTRKAIRAFHDYHAEASQPQSFDEKASGVILSSVYMQPVGMQMTAFILNHTEAPAKARQWPKIWASSGFASLWALYRQTSCKPHHVLVDALGETQPAGQRHIQATTTVRNDIGMLNEAYEIFCRATREMKSVKGLMCPFTFQGVLPGWMNKGFPNVLGLEGCKEPLVNISTSTRWNNQKDDQHVRDVLRRMFEEIEAAATARGASHPYKFMNYCADWQTPFDGCGEENLKFMRETSHSYDPEGLFTTGCISGFKLPEVAQERG